MRAVVANRSLHFLESPLQAWHRSDGQYSAVRAGARGAAVAAVLARYCAAWRAALAGGGAQLDVCAAPVLPREKSTRETADG